MAKILWLGSSKDIYEQNSFIKQIYFIGHGVFVSYWTDSNRIIEKRAKKIDLLVVNQGLDFQTCMSEYTVGLSTVLNLRQQGVTAPVIFLTEKGKKFPSDNLPENSFLFNKIEGLEAFIKLVEKILSGNEIVSKQQVQ